MSNLSAYDILEKIRKMEEEYIVNGNPVLTDYIKQETYSVNWDEIKEINTDKMALKQSSQMEAVSEEKKGINVDIPINTAWYDFSIRQMNENKNITKLIPPKTRFRLLKIIINRILMVVTRNQEIFNNHAVNLVGQSVQKINESIAAINDINRNLRKIEGSFNEKINETINDIGRKLNKIENSFDEKSNNNGKCNSNVMEQNERINEIEKKLKTLEDSLIYRINNHENWLTGLSNQLKNDEMWLQSTNLRIDGQEKWLSTTNKRIDSCNEMLSSNPVIGYQCFSQAGEDIIVTHILSKIKREIGAISYLDIGCNHYKNYNNTYRFYLKGYSGVLVEANPLLIDEIKRYRPRDIVLNIGIGINSGQILDFYVVNGGGLSSFNREFIDKAISNNPDVFVERIEKIKIMTINDVIDKYFDKTPTIVSIDIEGDEYKVLESLDELKYRPIVFIIETIEYRKNLTYGTKRNDIIELMKKKGYLEYAFTGINSIFVDANVMIEE